MLVNRNTKNEALLLDEAVRTALEGGNCILIDKKVTSNPDYTTLYVAGFVENEGTSNSNGAQAQLLGWDKPQIYVARCVQNAKTAIADKFDIGHVFPDFALQIVDSNKPQYPEHEPRQSKKGEIYLSAETGEKIYRSFMLTTKAELAKQGHQIIKRQPTATVAVSAKFEEMLSTIPG